MTLYAINSREPRQFARLDAALAAASLITPLDQVTFRTTDAVPTHDDIVTESQSASARRQLKVAQAFTPTEAPTQQTPLANLQERAKLAIALCDDKLMRQCFDELATLEAV